jgi:hypothetical protein
MSSDFLKSFLSAVRLPPALADHVIDEYQDSYASELAHNRSLGPSAVRLVKSKLTVNAMRSLVFTGEPGVLDAVLSTNERRDYVIDTMLRPCRLSPADQLRLVSRKLSPAIADDMLRHPQLTDQAKRKAAFRASESMRASWLRLVQLDEDEVFAHLSDITAPKLLQSTTIPLLRLSRSLRTRCVVDGPDHLLAAACWTELDQGEQEVAASRIMAGTTFSHLDPTFGLLAHPGLDQKLRDSLWLRLSSSDRTAAGYLGVVAPKDTLMIKGRLADLDDNAQVTALLTAVKPTSNHSLAKLRSDSVLFELSRNLHLSLAVREKVARALVAHASTIAQDELHALRVALSDIALRMDPSQKPALTLKRLGLKGYVARTLEVAPRLLRSGEADTGKPEEDPSPYEPHVTSPPVTPETVLAMPFNDIGVAWRMDYVSSCLAGASEAFAKILGDATTPRSVRAWMVFLNLASTASDVPLATVAATAADLARIEHPMDAL